MILLLARGVVHGRLGLLREHTGDHQDRRLPIHSCRMDLCYILRRFSQSRLLLPLLCCYGDCCFGYHDYDHQELQQNVLKRIDYCIDCLLRSLHRGVVVAVLLICEMIAANGQNCWWTLV